MGVEVVIIFEVNTVCGAGTEVRPLGVRFNDVIPRARLRRFRPMDRTLGGTHGGHSIERRIGNTCPCSVKFVKNRSAVLDQSETIIHLRGAALHFPFSTPYSSTNNALDFRSFSRRVFLRSKPQR